MSKIKCEREVIKDVFGNKYWYNIPNYQRQYVWQEEQITTLLENIEERMGDDEEYFLGSVVLQKTDERDYNSYDVLDGQQRLTTLTLIFIVLDCLIVSKKIDLDINKFIKQKEVIIEKIPERRKLLFDSRKDITDFLQKISNGESGMICKIISMVDDYKFDGEITKDISIRNMIIVIKKIVGVFKDKSGEYITKFLSFLLNNVVLIILVSDKLDYAIQLFKIINTSGIKLRDADILKSDNLKEINDKKKQEDYAKDWEEMEEYFGDSEDFDKYLSHVRTIVVGKRSKEGLLKEYEKYVYKKVNKGNGFFELVKKYYKIYNTLFNRGIKDRKVVNQIILMKNGLENDLWIPPLLKYYEKYEDKGLYEFLLKLDNKNSSDWILGETPTKRIENMNKIMEQIDKNEEGTPFNLLKNDCFKIVDSDRLSIIFNETIYGKKWCKYLLLKISLDFVNKGDEPFSQGECGVITIEHILPQKPNDNSEWKKDFSDKQREEFTHKVGNLILLSKRKNVGQSNLDYKDKKDKYYDSDISTFAITNRVIAKNDKWKVDDFEKNQKEKVERLKRIYEI